MTEISIDTKKRSLRLRIDLAGEAEPVDVHIKKYDLRRRGGAVVLTIVEATTSREWIRPRCAKSWWVAASPFRNRSGSL